MTERERMPSVEPEREREPMEFFGEFKNARDHQKIRDYFLSVASPETKEVSKILENLVGEWSTSETTVELRLEGSLNYGQVSAEETRDVDLVYMSNNLDDFEQATRKDELISRLRTVLPKIEDVEMDIIDLSLVENYIKSRERSTHAFKNRRLSPYVQELFIG